MPGPLFHHIARFVVSLALLAMAPAVLLAQGADYVDLDGPLLLERDREHGLAYEAGMVFPPSPALWG
jgi:hypothetical protein